MKKYSEDLYLIFDKATALSAKFYHNWTGTPHTFVALLSFLKNDTSGKYKKTSEKVLEILHNYNVDGEKFKEKFLNKFPKGAPGEGTFQITVDREMTKIFQSLERKMLSEKRSMDVEDLVLELFNDNNFELREIIAEITGENEADKLYEEIVKIFKRATIKTIEDLDKLSPVLNNLNKYISTHPQTVIGADNYVNALEVALAGRSIRNGVLIGEAGTGKTTILYEFVQRILDGNVPEMFKDKIVYSLDPAALTSGTRYRGDFEEKLTNILSIVKSHPEVILFVDEAHMLIKAGDSSDGAMSAGNILKPYVSNGEIQMILATTNEEYTKFIRGEKAFARRFHEIKVYEPSREETIEILKGLLPVETEYFNREIQEELVERVVDLSNKYTLDQHNPAKSINMMQLACAHAVVFEQQKIEVNVDNLIKAIKLKYNIYITEHKYAETKEALFKELLGQEEPLNRVCRNLKLVEKGIIDPERPMFSMLLGGSTGVGKTATARIIAKHFFGSENNLIKINMSEYSTETSVTKLRGADPNYVGYEDEPALIKGVRQTPNSVVLFDECEKAHPSIWKVLLPILDTGELNDNKGNIVSFRNTIIIFTSNLGCDKDTGKATGAGFIKTVSQNKENSVMKAIEDYFSPEFLGRLDDIIIYNSLTKEIARKLVQRYIDFFNRVAGLKLTFTPEQFDKVIEDSNIETRGARGLKKAVQKQFLEMES